MIQCFSNVYSNEKIRPSLFGQFFAKVRVSAGKCGESAGGKTQSPQQFKAKTLTF